MTKQAKYTRIEYRVVIGRKVCDLSGLFDSYDKAADHANTMHYGEGAEVQSRTVTETAWVREAS